jgi:hypothetical protein
MKGIVRMKRMAMALGAALIASTLMADTPVPPKPPNIGWVSTMSTQKGTSLLVSVRNQVPSDVKPAAYPKIVEIHWKYAPDDKGMPANLVITQMARLEAAVDPIQGDRLGYLMMIVTGGGERVWLWYVSDPKAFAADLNRLIPDHPFPITLHAAAIEPDWQTYRLMRDKIK